MWGGVSWLFRGGLQSGPPFPEGVWGGRSACFSTPEVGNGFGVPLSMGLAVAVGSLGVLGDNGGLPNSTGLVAAMTSRVTWP